MRKSMWWSGSFLVGIGTMLGMCYAGNLKLPDAYNPLAPIDWNSKPNILTRFKLGRLKRDTNACVASLRESDLQFSRMEPHTAGTKACPLSGAIRIQRGEDLRFSAAFTSTCAMGAALALFNRHTLQPKAQEYFNQPVARVTHVGSFACRNVYGRKNARRSEHAKANALDVTGFVLEDGTEINITRDWESDNHPQRAAFLKDVHAGACGVFNTVLGPEHNDEHKTHFHLDMGGWWMCR